MLFFFFFSQPQQPDRERAGQVSARVRAGQARPAPEAGRRAVPAPEQNLAPGQGAPLLPEAAAFRRVGFFVEQDGQWCCCATKY